MIPWRIMRPSVARDGEQLDPRCSIQTYHRPNQRTRPSSSNPWATAHFPSRWGYEAELAWAHSRLATVWWVTWVTKDGPFPFLSWLQHIVYLERLSENVVARGVDDRVDTEVDEPKCSEYVEPLIRQPPALFTESNCSDAQKSTKMLLTKSLTTLFS